MGTLLEVTAEGPAAEAAVAAAFAEVDRWDRVLSTYKKESEASALNREPAGKPFRCSRDLWDELVAAQAAARDSGGAFDVVYPEDYRALVLDESSHTATFAKPGMRVDFGGIGKGFALDRAIGRMKEAGASAGLLNFGGQLAVFGKPWPVVIPGEARPRFLKEGSVSTSGNAERPGHIVSPFTRRPIRASGEVTVIARTAAQADAWSTALFVLGKRGVFENPQPLGASR
jgi:thiamine biosynthesis lipoprotein